MSLSKEIKNLQKMEQNIVLLLIGKTGSGKSATGNIIFNSKTMFESKKSSSSVTRVCQIHTDAVYDRSVTVIDTPDFRFSTHNNFDSESELKKALELCSPGAHAILLILTLSAVTELEMDFIGWFEQKFGVEALRFTLVLFTHAGEIHMRSLGEIISENTQLSNFINRCGQRYYEFNIKAPANRDQVSQLMEKIHRMQSENTNSCYTLDMMLDTEKRREENVRRAEEENRREVERKAEEKKRSEEEEDRRAEEEFAREEDEREREHRITLHRILRETEMRVRRESNDRKGLKRTLETVWNGFKLIVKQINLKSFCVILFFAVVTGGVLMRRKGSLNGWVFIQGFFTGGSASTAGVYTWFLWRLISKSHYVGSSHTHPSGSRQFLLKGAGVACAASAGSVIGHFLGGNVIPVTVLSGLAGALAALMANQ